MKNIGHLARLKKRNIHFAIKLSLREISFVVYVHTLIAYTNDAKIVRSTE